MISFSDEPFIFIRNIARRRSSWAAVLKCLPSWLFIMDILYMVLLLLSSISLPDEYIAEWFKDNSVNALLRITGFMRSSPTSQTTRTLSEMGLELAGKNTKRVKMIDK
jgi:hypothetical protein